MTYLLAGFKIQFKWQFSPSGMKNLLWRDVTMSSGSLSRSCVRGWCKLMGELKIMLQRGSHCATKIRLGRQTASHRSGIVNSAPSESPRDRDFSLHRNISHLAVKNNAGQIAFPWGSIGLSIGWIFLEPRIITFIRTIEKAEVNVELHSRLLKSRSNGLLDGTDSFSNRNELRFEWFTVSSHARKKDIVRENQKLRSSACVHLTERW